MVWENLFNTWYNGILDNYLLGCDRSGTHQCYQLDLRRGTVDCIQTNCGCSLLVGFPELYWRLGQR